MEDMMKLDNDMGVDMAVLDRILAERVLVAATDLSPLLQEIQAGYGYLPPGVLLEMSWRTGIPASQIYGVATFYEQFHLEPHGRHTVRCCRGTACHVKGGHGMIQAVSRELGIAEGQTTEDMRFTFETVACLGTCFLAPVVMVDKDYYGNMTPTRVRGILNRYK
jgi:NADH:ubiquinone oxidoreductase subunit E